MNDFLYIMKDVDRLQHWRNLGQEGGVALRLKRFRFEAERARF